MEVVTQDVVASFHLTRERPLGAVADMVGMLGQGRLAATVPGLRFARRLGTGRGRAMSGRGDLRRWALFAVWDREADLDAFSADHPLARRWQTGSVESWSVRLAPLAAHGNWAGIDVLGGCHRPLDLGSAKEGPEPVAVLTRARIPTRHWRSFRRAVPPVAAQLAAAPGLVEVAGVGERPVGLLATFSVWRSGAHADAFAHGPGAHAEVVGSTRRGGWFAEELFARFRPYGSTGTWDGRDPLADALACGPEGGKGS